MRGSGRGAVLAAASVAVLAVTLLCAATFSSNDVQGMVHRNELMQLVRQVETPVSAAVHSVALFELEQMRADGEVFVGMRCGLEESDTVIEVQLGYCTAAAEMNQ